MSTTACYRCRYVCRYVCRWVALHTEWRRCGPGFLHSEGGTWDLHSRLDHVTNSTKKPLRISLAAGQRDIYSGKGCMRLPGDYPLNADYNTLNSCAPGVKADGHCVEPGPWRVAFVAGNDRMSAALMHKGYDTRYTFALDGCHCDPKMYAMSFANDMVWLWKNWRRD